MERSEAYYRAQPRSMSRLGSAGILPAFFAKLATQPHTKRTDPVFSQRLFPGMISP
jgi:hypothetical protein